MLALKKNNLILTAPLEWVAAFALTVPTYIIFFIGMEPYMQAIAYSLYIIPICLVFIRKRHFPLSTRFIILWTIFLVFWITPSILNRISPTLESDLVSLPVLFYHVVMLSAVVIFLNIYVQDKKSISKELLMRSIFWTLAPMVLLIFFKSIYLDFQEDARPSPFRVNANTNVEIIFTFMLVALRLTGNIIKFFAIVLAITTCYILESRGGLISCYIALLLTYGPPWLHTNFKHKYFLFFLFVILFISVFFHNEIYSLFNSTLMLDIRLSSLTDRLIVWELAIESIIQKPFSGTGFWVNPMGYSVPEGFPEWATIDNYQLVVHNAFLRIATENGILLFLMIISFVVISCYRLLKNNFFKDFALVISVLFFLFFCTRHLTLNLMNVLLYFTIIRALTLDRKFSSK